MNVITTLFGCTGFDILQKEGAFRYLNELHRVITEITIDNKGTYCLQ